VLIEAIHGRIVSVEVAPGPTADLKLLEKSGTYVCPGVRLLGDLSYMGHVERIGRLSVPHRKPPNRNGVERTLTKEQKAQNRLHSQERVAVEHVICRLKVFRLLASRYRNRRCRYGLRVSLIAALVNRDRENIDKATKHGDL
jgi:hypothetical protein